MPLVWDFVGKTFHAGPPPGHVERDSTAASPEQPIGLQTRDRVENPPQQMYAHGSSVPVALDVEGNSPILERRSSSGCVFFRHRAFELQ